jgi:hypothetical protein
LIRYGNAATDDSRIFKIAPAGVAVLLADSKVDGLVLQNEQIHVTVRSVRAPQRRAEECETSNMVTEADGC